MVRHVEPLACCIRQGDDRQTFRIHLSEPPPGAVSPIQLTSTARGIVLVEGPFFDGCEYAKRRCRIASGEPFSVECSFCFHWSSSQSSHSASVLWQARQSGWPTDLLFSPLLQRHVVRHLRLR